MVQTGTIKATLFWVLAHELLFTTRHQEVALSSSCQNAETGERS